MDTSSRVRLARTFAGMSQAELGDRIFVAQTSITRYEGKRPPGTSMLHRIAEATKMPANWLCGSKFSGYFAGRIELPGVEYSNKTIRAIEDHLAVLLPMFIEENTPTSVIAVKPSGVTNPRAFVLSNDTYCLVLFTIETTKFVEGYLKPSKTVSMDTGEWVSAYLQPEYQYLRRIVEVAHGENTQWSSQIKVTKGSHLWTNDTKSEGKYIQYIPPPNAPDHLRLTWVDFIIRYLESVGCTDVRCETFEEHQAIEPKYPSFAPKDFKMTWLHLTQEEADLITE